MTKFNEKDKATKELLDSLEKSKSDLKQLSVETLKELHNCIHGIHTIPTNYIISSLISGLLSDLELEFNDDMSIKEDN